MQFWQLLGDAVDGLPALPQIVLRESCKKKKNPADSGISACGMFENRLFSASSIF